MAIRRKFRCEDCQGTFWSWDPIEEAQCPKCSQPAQWEPGIGGITHMKTKNTDAVTDHLMTTHELTDMRDYQREGDQSQKLTPTQNKMLAMAGGSIFNAGGGLQSAIKGADLGPVADRAKGMEAMQKLAKNSPIPITKMFA